MLYGMMGNSYAGQLKTTRFEEVLHNSIEASLRSNNLVPRPVFSQLYLEAEHQLISNLEACKRPGNEEEEEDDGSETSSPLIPYQMKPPPEGCCTTDGFCQAGKDLRLVSMSNEQIEVPSGFLLIGAKSPNLPEHLLVCAVDKRFLPDDNGRNALLGFSGNCVGCGEKGFRYFTEFSNHINLKLITQPKKQKHLKCYLIKNAQGSLTKGPLICWKGTEGRTQQSSSSSTSSIPSQPPESPASSTTVASAESISGTNHNALTGFQQAGAPTDHTLSRAATGVSAAHNNRDSSRHQNPMKPNNVSCQNMSRPSVIGNLANSGPPKKRHRGWSPDASSATETSSIQSNPLAPNSGSKAAPDQVPLIEDLELILVRAWQESNLTETKQYQQAVSQSVPYASSPTLTVTATQLTWLAKLAASSCKNVVRILDSSSTLVEGLTETFKLLSEGKLQGKNFVVIICTTKNQSTESCVVVTGKRQAGFLAERMLSPKEHLKEINYELVTGKVGALGAFFSSLCPEGDIDALLEKCGLAKNGQGSSVTASLNKCDDTTLQRPTICSVSNKESCQIHPVQLAVARKLLSHVCAIADSSTQNLDLGSFEKVDFLILIPPSEVAYQQTVLRVRQSAALAYERLCQVRYRLGLQHRFEIILGMPNTKINISQHFLTQLKVWQKIEDPNWTPLTYMDLEDLPCILILSGTDPYGESFPRSAKYYDLRLINSTCLLRTALEQELGLAACYVVLDVPRQTVIVNDLSESDLDKPGSTDDDEWTVTKRNHMDFNKTQNRTEMFHPRRLLLNGPPQVGKTGAYLQFLSILSRMLIRLMEVDVYDEEEINLKTKEDSALQQKESLLWPDLESFSTLLFDYTVHDPKYEDASPVYSRDLAKNKGYKANKKEDDIYLRRHTTRMRLSKYAACNTYHHCEQCHEYMGFSPRCQPYDSTLHAFTFSCSILGEEVQLHFIIPKSKEHNFIFSQPAGQLESMRLPLVTDK
ncbi:hypothetical protein scyTo_0007449, partial [Scyliorhinus torazame]|nr:hypothetical protein [Scyliorhinus torazame]